MRTILSDGVATPVRVGHDHRVRLPGRGGQTWNEWHFGTLKSLTAWHPGFKFEFARTSRRRAANTILRSAAAALHKPGTLCQRVTWALSCKPECHGSWSESPGRPLRRGRYKAEAPQFRVRHRRRHDRAKRGHESPAGPSSGFRVRTAAPGPESVSHVLATCIVMARLMTQATRTDSDSESDHHDDPDDCQWSRYNLNPSTFAIENVKLRVKQRLGFEVGLLGLFSSFTQLAPQGRLDCTHKNVREVQFEPYRWRPCGVIWD